MIFRRAPLLFVTAALCAASPAHAGSKAWAQAKTRLPAGLQIVFGVNAGSLQSSQLFQSTLPLLEQRLGTSGDQIDSLHKTCGIDMLKAIDSIVVGLTDDQKGVIVVALKGTTRADLETCAQKVAKANGKTATIAKAGELMSYTLDDKQMFVRWLANDVIAFTTDPTDRDLLTKMTAGGLAKDKGLAHIAKVKTDAGVWVAVDRSDTLPEVNVKMTGAYGSADVAGGNILLDFRVLVESAAAATKAAGDLRQKIGELLKQSAPAAQLWSSFKISSAGPELSISGNLAEKDLAGVLATLH